MDAASILFVIFILGIGTVAIWPGSRATAKAIVALCWRSV
jgi:hypothetical protein